MDSSNVIMSAMGSQITSSTIVYSTVYSDTDEKKSKLRVTSLCAENSPVTDVTRKMFPFDDVITKGGNSFKSVISDNILRIIRLISTNTQLLSGVRQNHIG